MKSALAAALVWLTAGAGWATPACGPIQHDGNRYTVCRVDVTKDTLRLFLNRPDGGPFAQFGAIDMVLAEKGAQLSFAMNAGMYHTDRSPVGLYVEDGKELQGIVTSAGPGNFGLLPNGVLCLREGRADVIETIRFAKERPDCRHATQSGPMLVIDGALHPRFLADSDSRHIRNGVGTRAHGREAVFAISENPVTFHEFGSLFRDVLGTPNALYLDGNISRLHAPGLGRSDSGFAMGPIVGTVSREP
jgi:uncharacterized protein YigE (DUF2233 family)